MLIAEEKLHGISVERLGLLLDWRLGPLFTDPHVHQLVVAGSDALCKRFVCRAQLFATPLGALQANRLPRQTRNEQPTVFEDERAAIAFVSGQ